MKTKKQEIREGLADVYTGFVCGIRVDPDCCTCEYYISPESKCRAGLQFASETMRLLDQMGVRIVNVEELPENPRKFERKLEERRLRMDIEADLEEVAYWKAQQDMLKWLNEKGRLIDEKT